MDRENTALYGMTNGSELLIGTGRDVGLNRLMTRCTFIERTSPRPVSSPGASTIATNTSLYALADSMRPGVSERRSITMKLNESLNRETRFDTSSPYAGGASSVGTVILSIVGPDPPTVGANLAGAASRLS